MHEELLQISEDKTEYIKKGDMEQLSKLLIQERKQLQLITQIEADRQQQVEHIFNHLHIDSEDKTVSKLLKYVNTEDEKREIEHHVTALVEIIVKLKQSEQLNNDLLQQSMQFVQFSLDMLQPSMKNMNYNEKSSGNETVKRSVFDSKA